jgi:hypothetical protein
MNRGRGAAYALGCLVALQFYGCGGSGASSEASAGAGGSAGSSLPAAGSGGALMGAGGALSITPSGGIVGTAGTGASATSEAGGAPAAGGAVSTGGTPSIGGSGGAVGSGGTTSSGGSGGSGAAGASGGATTGGVGGMATAGGAAGAPSCGSASNPTPFGCKFAWGTNEPTGALSSYSYLDFISKWVGYEIAADGSFKSCDGCTWLSSMVQTSLVPVYYAYFIGYLGHANGLPDGNQNPSGPNLTTDAALLIRKQRANLVGAYAEYARRSHAAWPTKPLVWLLEGDFVQYAGSTQKQALTYTELGQLAQDITCAIKGNMPNAVVAINQSTWNADQVTMDFWGAMKQAPYDVVWTTGVANNDGFFEASANASSYNHATATYRYVHTLTGKPLFVDTSFGLSAMADSWSGASASVIDARVADGVIAANVTSPDANYASRLGTLRQGVNAVCH